MIYLNEDASGNVNPDLGFAGAYNDGTTTQNYSNGYIDDLRITKGLARYVDSFAPPIAQFPDL